jgi:poly-gamma-glutamate system protein
MKLYWRPGKVSNASLLVLALIAISFMIIVEANRVMIKQRWYEEKVRTVKRQARAMEVIKRETLRHRKTLDRFADPAETGLIGLKISPITSVVGYLAAKQTSVNPNYAAVVVHMMKRLKLEPGDYVAVGASGSFPSLNLATMISCRVLKLNCVLISSLSASMYGANDPKMTWLDMERIAYVEGLIDARSVAASIGGMDDNGEQLGEEGIRLILEAIERNETRLIRRTTLEDNIDERMRLYDEAAGGQSYKAYVNVGGNQASVGSHFTKVLFRPGLNRRFPRKPIDDEGVMTLMMRKYGCPVIHLSGVSRIAERYGIELAPTRTPKLGVGKLFYDMEYNLTVVWLLLALLLAVTVIVVSFDVGKLFSGVGPRGQHGAPLPPPPGSPAVSPPEAPPSDGEEDPPRTDG